MEDIGVSNKQEMDIFDRILAINSLRAIKPFYEKYREVILYLFFGALTVLISVIVYCVLSLALGINELIANIFAWLFSVLFAYLTNRKWVFKSDAKKTSEVIKETIFFFGGRVCTLFIEEFVLLVFISIMNFSSVIVKLIAQIIVVLLNYIFSKFFVF